MEQTDESVVALVQSGDSDAYGLLIERYQPKLTRYAHRFLFFDEDATDLVQDVFIKAYTNIQSFSSGKRFSPWIYRIAHNVYVNELRRKKKAPVRFFDPDTLWPHPVATETADTEALTREHKENMERYLHELNPKYREPLVLFFYESMSYQDIADVLEIPTSTVGVRISRAKQKLRTLHSKEQTT